MRLGRDVPERRGLVLGKVVVSDVGLEYLFGSLICLDMGLKFPVAF